MATQIANSVVDNSAASSSDFTATSDYLIVVSAGQVQLEVKISGSYYVLSSVDDHYGAQTMLGPGTGTRITNLESGATYRLTPIGGKATASAWALT